MEVSFDDGPWSAGVPIQDLPGDLPSDTVPRDVQLGSFPEIARDAFNKLGSSRVLSGDALWHDMLAVTGEVHTRYGSDSIAKQWNASMHDRQLRNFTSDPSSVEVQRLPGSSWVKVSFKFQSSTRTGLVANCSGYMCLVSTREARWRIWVLFTMLENYSGHHHPDFPLSRNHAIPSAGVDYSAIVIGAGQGGLSIAGRLQALGIEYVVLERSSRSGNSWVSKYDTVRQHTIKEINHLPFGRTWDEHAPEFLPAAEVTSGFERWVEKHKINLWTDTEVVSCVRDEHRSLWIVQIAQKTHSNRQTTLTCRHLLFCIGIGLSRPRRPPTFPGEADFKGTVMHMADFKNAKPWKGRQGVVIGSGTAAHDIADDMYCNGLDSVTMVQRNRTAVYPMEWYAGTQRGAYNKSVSPESADRVAMTLPLKINTLLQSRSYQAYIKSHKTYFTSLDKVGFQLDLTSTPNEIVYNHFGGYYIDIGTSSLIANGEIKIRNGITIDHFSQEEVVFSDGSTTSADLVVFATGYHTDYREDLARFVGVDIARRIPKIWGVSPHGDLRGMMAQSAPGLWILGGAAVHARFFSRFIALQIQEEALNEIQVGGRDRESRL